MKKLALIFAALVSTTAFAANTEFKTGGFETQSQAFAAGFEVAENINNMDQTTLMKTFRVYSVADYGSVVVNDVEVKLETFAQEEGVIQYRAIVDVEYDYDS